MGGRWGIRGGEISWEKKSNKENVGNKQKTYLSEQYKKLLPCVFICLSQNVL